MKTPDEIKKGLEQYMSVDAYDCEISCKDSGCPYSGDERIGAETCGDLICADVLAYIKQLEADNAQQARCIENLTDKLNATNDALAAKAGLVEQYRWERDVAIGQLEQLGIGFGEKVNGKLPHWISVEERLPVEPCAVLVVMFGNSVCVAWYSIGWFETGSGLHFSAGNGVTHWMPMPEPPVEV